MKTKPKIGCRGWEKKLKGEITLPLHQIVPLKKHQFYQWDKTGFMGNNLEKIAKKRFFFAY